MHTGAARHGGDEATSGFCPGRGDHEPTVTVAWRIAGVDQLRMRWGAGAGSGVLSGIAAGRLRTQLLSAWTSMSEMGSVN